MGYPGIPNIYMEVPWKKRSTPNSSMFLLDLPWNMKQTNSGIVPIDGNPPDDPSSSSSSDASMKPRNCRHLSYPFSRQLRVQATLETGSDNSSIWGAGVGFRRWRVSWSGVIEINYYYYVPLLKWCISMIFHFYLNSLEGINYDFSLIVSYDAVWRDFRVRAGNPHLSNLPSRMFSHKVPINVFWYLLFTKSWPQPAWDLNQIIFLPPQIQWWLGPNMGKHQKLSWPLLSSVWHWASRAKGG